MGHVLTRSANYTAQHRATRLAGLAIQDRKVCAPRTDCITILPGHHSAELGDVTEVVSHPRRQELPQRHQPKRRMLTFEGKLVLGQPPRCKSVQVLRTQVLELVDQRDQ